MEQNFNHVLLCGQVLTQPQPSHVNHSQKLSRFPTVRPPALRQEDCLPVIVPQPLLERAVPCPPAQPSPSPASFAPSTTAADRGHGWWCRSLPRPSSPAEKGR